VAALCGVAQDLLAGSGQGFSHAPCPSGNRRSSAWTGHAAGNKSSVISFQLSVTTVGKAIADSG
jgi:hypothetical protein